jgi:hypothetical protein
VRKQAAVKQPSLKEIRKRIAELLEGEPSEMGAVFERIMSRSSKERERQLIRAGNQTIKPLKLAMGEPNRCFYPTNTNTTFSAPSRFMVPP